MTERRIYLDHNATSPLLPEALEAMLPLLRDGAANASSTHRDGQRARLAIEEAREDVAALAGVPASEIVFTSGGTEAANAAILGTALAVIGADAEVERGRGGAASSAHQSDPVEVQEASRRGTPRERRDSREDGRGPSLRSDVHAPRHRDVNGSRRWSMVSTTLEHPAVHRSLRGVERLGFDVRRIAPRPEGVLAAEDVLEAVDETTVLVSVMHVNNEIGTVQPVGEIADACAARGIPVHSDAVQSLGRIPLPLRASLLGLSAHKIGGPQGIGALIVRKGVALEPLLRGGPQEMRRRAGTENTAGIAGFGAAARAARSRQGGYARRVGALRERLEAGLCARFPGVTIHGAKAPRVANTSAFALPAPDGGDRLEGVALQIALDLAGFSVSTGTACASGKTGPSYVLEALGAPEDVARGSLRVSLGWSTTAEEIDCLLGALEAAWRSAALDVSSAARSRPDPALLDVPK